MSASCHSNRAARAKIDSCVLVFFIPRPSACCGSSFWLPVCRLGTHGETTIIESLKKFSNMTRPFWAGWHREIGGVIYDPAAQHTGISSKVVWLYVLNENCYQFFDKDKARLALVPQSDGEIGIVARKYCQALASSRPPGEILSASKIDETTSTGNYPEEAPGRDEDDERVERHLQEFSDTQESYERSSEDGWFYGDSD